MFGLRRRRRGKSSLLKFGVNLKGNDTLNFPVFLKKSIALKTLDNLSESTGNKYVCRAASEIPPSFTHSLFSLQSLSFHAIRPIFTCLILFFFLPFEVTIWCHLYSHFFIS